MKKSFGIIMALMAMIGMLAFGGQALAYQVIGDAAHPGAYSFAGSLSTLLSITDGGYKSAYGASGGDYIIVTGSTGATVLISSGELQTGALTASLVSNGSGYNLNAGARSITNVTSIQAVAVPKPTNYPGSKYEPSTAFTVYGTGITPTVFNLTGVGGINLSTMSGQITDYYHTSGKSSDDTYTGPTIQAVLLAAGVNTGNLNQYVIVQGVDGYYEVLSMAEIDSTYTTSTLGGAKAGQQPLVAWWMDGALLFSSSGQMRTAMPGDNGSTGRFTKFLYNVDVEPGPAPTPLPAALYLLGPGLAGLAALKRRFI